MGRGATFKEISKKIVENIEIPLPALQEQHAIVDRLALLEKLLNQQNERLTTLDTLIKSRFVEMFGDPVLNPKGWEVFSWSDVFKTKTGKLDSNAAVENGQYPFFTCAKEQLWIDKYAYDEKALLLAGNNATGNYDVKYYQGKFNAYQRTYILNLKNDNWSYLLFQVQLNDKLTYLQSQSKGSNTKYLTMGILKSLSFIVPPIELQNQFAEFVQQVDQAKQSISTSIETLQTLKASLMQKYFH